METIKICKLWGKNNLGINSEYPCEIIENHPIDQKLPPNYIILSDSEIKARIEAHQAEAIEIFEKQNRLRKYLCNDGYEDPKNQDFNILPLFSQEIFTSATFKTINHWKNYNLSTFVFSNLAISEEVESFFDTNNILKYQKNTIRFYKEKFIDDLETDFFYDEKIVINTKDFI